MDCSTLERPSFKHACATSTEVLLIYNVQATVSFSGSKPTLLKMLNIIKYNKLVVRGRLIMYESHYLMSFEFGGISLLQFVGVYKFNFQYDG